MVAVEPSFGGPVRKSRGDKVAYETSHSASQAYAFDARHPLVAGVGGLADYNELA